jgi:hypothetical protein
MQALMTRFGGHPYDEMDLLPFNVVDPVKRTPLENLWGMGYNRNELVSGCWGWVGGGGKGWWGGGGGAGGGGGGEGGWGEGSSSAHHWTNLWGMVHNRNELVGWWGCGRDMATCDSRKSCCDISHCLYRGQDR